jgi:hypothetical protein
MSRPTIYLVPGIAAVSVAADVVPPVLSSLEFQLGYFRVEASDSLQAELARIDVKPFVQFERGQGEVHFHSSQGKPGELLHSESRRHALRQTPKGFQVFTDTPELAVVVLLQLLALRRGFTLLHSAGWCDPTGAVTLLPGPGGVGKTALLSAAVLRHEARLLGDDLVLVGHGAQAEAFPRSFVLKPYHRSLFPDVFADLDTGSRHQARWRPVVGFLRDNAPFKGVLKSVARRFGRLEEASLWLQEHAVDQGFYTVPVTRLFGADRIGRGGPVRRVVYLERYDGSEFCLEIMPAEAVVRRSVAVLHHEWADYMRWICACGAMEVLDLGSYFRQVESAMLAAFAAAEIYELKVPLRATPEELERIFAQRLGFGAEPA